MAKVKITGHASGTGILTVTAPNTSTDRTITLPDATGTLATTADSVGGATGVDFNDNVKIRLGTGNDYELYHDGTNTYMDNNTGALFMRNNGSVVIEDLSGNNIIRGIDGGAVDLYHNGSAKLTTTSTGLTVTGEVTTTTGKLTNTPSFSAYRASGEQSVSDGTWTKVEFPNEHWDSDSAFDTTNDKFIVPSGEGGKYLFNYAARGESLDAGEHAMLRLYKNGSALDETRTNGYAAVDNQQVYIRGSAMLALAAADYIELWAYQNEGASRNLHNEYLHFSGMKLIGV